ncbi:PREDICTED: phytanoyl-CoA dioxygenase-like isoform X1 [Branchiostoma belcheri]|uniref:Phytanoyl-CoA dioxygenase-like isoform X1 n=1 Tax=Branchiostoma belcheri TaxID=7741 RepID=A0A6P5ADV0_BRABE|nr:PREDICTED: phytanoyl-CoA dioxygenase-like isoform X1 [Branchiostoma belcheri]
MTSTEENYEPPRKKPAPPASCPQVYLTPPPQPRDKKPGQLSKAQVDQYFRDGYLVVTDFFPPEELQPVREAVEERVDHLAQTLYRAGKIKDKHEEAGLFQRLTLLNEEFPGAAVVLVKSRRNMPKAFRDLWSHERLLNAVEQLIGPDIAGHQVWNLRSKTPTNEALTVPWHQDNAYLLPDCLGTLQPTAWIPLLDATKKNGCMQVLKGGHRKGITATHTCCAGGTWYVEVSAEEMEKTLGCDMERDLVTCEVPYGGVLFLNNCIPHRSLENYSDEIRWSLDLRWQDPNKPSGFWGEKDLVLMRTAKDPGYKPRWEEFLHDEGEEEDGKVNPADLEPTIQGPWMLRWEIVHHNRHTKALTS